MKEIENTLFCIQKKNSIKINVIYNLTIFTFLLVLTSLPFIDVDITTQNNGVITSFYQNTELSAVTSGIVDYIDIRNNKEVLKGDTLMSIKPNELKQQIKTNSDLLEDTKNQINDLELLLEGIKDKEKIKTELYQNELISFYQRYDELILRKEQVYREFKTTKTLYTKKVIAKTEFEFKKYEYQLIRSQKKAFFENQMNTWQTRKKQLKIEAENIKSSLEQIKIQESNYHIIAPINGIIVNYNGIRKGSFLAPSQRIAEIAPNDSLIVDCFVKTSDIGYIKKRQKVKFQIDAFDYKQWGFVEGNVLDIHINPDEVNNQSFFRIKCSLNKKEVELKNGLKGKLKKGMTVRGRFFLAKKSIYNLLFDRVDEWFNPKT